MGEGARQSRSYVATWQEDDGSLARGGLTLEQGALLLRGTGEDGRQAARRLPFADLVGVSIGRGLDERLNGYPTLTLERRDGYQVRVSISGAGLLWELADLLAELIGGEAKPLEQVAVVARLREGMHERARVLIAEGPPFDPRASGLDKNDVFLTDDAVVFLFEGREIREFVQRLSQDPNLWEAAVDWDACLIGRPQLADVVYSWKREQAAAR